MVYSEKEISTYTDAVRAVLEGMEIDPDVRNILVAHQFVAGAVQCESEEISIGGLDQVDVSVLERFDYVALGHLHRPQSVGRETIRYCGTPLKYSFSEVHDRKSVTIVEMREKARGDPHGGAPAIAGYEGIKGDLLTAYEPSIL